MKPSPSRRLLPIVLLLNIAACSTVPIYDWRNDTTLIASKEPLTMDYAMGHLDRARQGYHKAVRLQMNEEAAVGNAFIIGSAALLTAAGLKAHSDVLLVGAAAIGTTYTLGDARLPRPRASTYLAGVDALNCAETAVSAVRVVDQTFAQDLGALDLAVAKLKTQLDLAQGKFATLPDTKLAAALDSARNTLDGAITTTGAGRAFLSKSRQAAALLYVQVEKVDKAVTEELISTTPNLEKIKQIAGGLGGTIGGIVSTAVTDAGFVRSEASKVAAQSTSGATAMDAVVMELLLAADGVRLAMTKVNSSLPIGYELLDTETIKTCGVAISLQASPMTLQFTAGESGKRVVQLRGGKQEYFAEIVGLPNGMSIKQAGPGGTTVEVSVDGTKLTAPGAYELHIRDQTPSGSGVVIRMTISPASPQKLNQAQQDSGTDPKNVKLDNGAFTVFAAKPSGDGKVLNVTVCGRPNATQANDIAKEIKQKTQTTLDVKVIDGKC